MACLISPACPFQTPISTILRIFASSQQLTTSVHGVPQRLLGIVKSRWTRLSQAFRGPVHAVGAFARRYLQLLFTTLHNGLRFVVPHFSTKVVDSEAQLLDKNMDVLADNAHMITLDLPDISTTVLEAPSIKWLLETSTDPEVFLTAARLVPH
ncbi:hypothetical protein EDB19DRAFT_1778065, partial [Suillus lakei]